MMEKEQMQTITVDGQAQEAWLSKVRRFHAEVKLLAVDTTGQQHILVDISLERASWQSFEGHASRFQLLVDSLKTSWSCHYGPTESLHIRVDGSGELEVWSGIIAVAKYFDVASAKKIWPADFIHAEIPRFEYMVDSLLGGNSMKIKSLVVSDFYHLTDLSPLSGLTQLKSLGLTGTLTHHIDFSPLARLPQLKHLNLSDRSEYFRFFPWKNFPQITSLEISGCREFGPLDNLTKLISMNLSHCGKLRDIKPLASLIQLTSLNISHCSEIRDLGPLASLTQLTSLSISNCSEIRDLGPLASLTQLTSLSISNCSEICDLGPLASLTQLTSLNLSHCRKPRDLGPLASLIKLTSLNTSHCREIRALGPLASLTKLTLLNISHCSEIREFGPLASLTQLTYLNLSHCRKPRDLGPLASLIQLTSLNLSHCSEIRDLGPLASLKKLTSLDLNSCNCLAISSPIAVLPSLVELDLRGCRNIRDADILCDATALCDFRYDDVPTLNIVRLACAIRSGSAGIVERTVTAAKYLEFAKNLERHIAHLISAVDVLRPRSADHAEVFRDVTGAFLTRRSDIPIKAWESMFAAIVQVPDPALRPAFETALTDLPLADIERVLGPALIALAETPASARGWALDLVQRALLPVVTSASHAREVAPAAAVFFHSQGHTVDVDVWLERGSVPQVPAWRDRVLVALIGRALRIDEILEARRLLGLVQTPARRDEARGMLVQHLAAKAEFRDASAELDAIIDRARRASTAAQALEQSVAFAGEPYAGLSLLLALDGDPDTLADVLTAMVQQVSDSELVHQLAAMFAPKTAMDLGGAVEALLAGDPGELACVLAAIVQQAPDSNLAGQLAVLFTPTAGGDFGEAVDALLAHESVTQHTKPKQLAGLRSRVRSDRKLSDRALIHGTVALLEVEGLVDDVEAAEVTAALLGESA